jgi:SPRY domain
MLDVWRVKNLSDCSISLGSEVSSSPVLPVLFSKHHIHYAQKLILRMRTQDIKILSSTPSGSSKKKFLQTIILKRVRCRLLKNNHMKHVSIRRRLVAWDSGLSDAQDDHPIETPFEFSSAPSRILVSEDEDSLQDLLLTRNRKRNRLEKGGIDKTLSLLELLCDDIHLQVALFLDHNDAQSFMMTDKRRYNLIKNSFHLWKQFCYLLWPHLPRNCSFVDSFSDKVINYAKLLSLACHNSPTCIDNSTFMLRRCTPIFRILDSPNCIQYVDRVGTGDRCIRSNNPFPKPEAKHTDKYGSLLNFLMPRRRHMKPFVNPYIDQRRNIILNPSYISYFEINILKDGPEVWHRPISGRRVSECVAVGLSTKSFNCMVRMPGWDGLSYGYHGDDGGLFHASGEMLKRFGPSYGIGDTVGCGIDFLLGGIFFTLNGSFLGYGWTGLDLIHVDLYPTVGLDCNAPVDCNFGDKPFLFDLVEFSMSKDA